MMKYLCLFKYAAYNRMTYRYDLMFKNIFFLVLLFVFYRLWFVLSQSGKLINNYNFLQLIWYFVITESLLSSFAMLRGVVDIEIQSGKIVQILTRPYSYILYNLSSYLGETLVMFLNNLIIGSVFGAIVAGLPSLTIANILILMPVFFLAILINFFIEFSISLVSFWTENATPFFWMYSKILFILGGLLIPIDYYPRALVLLCAYLPFQYVLYLPAKMFVNFNYGEFWTIFSTQCCWLFVFIVLVYFGFTAGLKRVCIHGG